MGKSTPSTPDPNATAAAQAAANTTAARESARLNAIDQYGPLGTTLFQRAADGTPTAQSITLAPGMQAYVDGQMTLANTLGNKAQQAASQLPVGPMDLSALPARQLSIEDAGAIQAAVPARTGEIQNLKTGALPALPGVESFEDAAATARQATFAKAQALLAPDLDQARSRTVQSLADRGIPLDSAAGQAELDRLDRARTQAMNSAAYDAVAAGGQEQSRLFGLASTARSQLFGEGLSTAGFDNQAAGQRFAQDRSAAELANAAQAQAFGQNAQQALLANQQRDASFSEALANRAQALTQMTGLAQATPSLSIPGFQATGSYGTQAPDISGLIQADYQNRLAAQQRQNQQAAGVGSAIAGALPYVLPLVSSRALKTDIADAPAVLDALAGLPIHVWRYRGEAGQPLHIGPMAEDWLRLIGTGDGAHIPVVDAIGLCLKAIQELAARPGFAGDGATAPSAAGEPAANNWTYS